MIDITHRRIILPVAALFFLSGVCALVYEVLWTRYLADLMGATSLSHLVVLMTFMGGLSLGAILIGRLVDSGRNGLFYYGWLEVGIGLYAVVFPFLYNSLSGIFDNLGGAFSPGTTGLLTLKLCVSFLLIAAPAIAMGGTLPAVTRYLTESEAILRRNISLLYAVNSLGAVLGVLLGGFYIVYRYGMDAGLIYTGIFNISLGAAALGLARFFDPGDANPVKEITGDVDSNSERRLDSLIYDPAVARRAEIAAGLAGFAGMALQFAWIRYFAIVLGATHSAFVMVVAAFIFGIGLGALAIRGRWFRDNSLYSAIIAAFLFITFILTLGLFLHDRVPFEISRFLATVIKETPFAWPFYLTVKFGISFLLMLPVTLAMGMILPLCVRIASRGSGRVGHDVARVYAINTLGALLGIAVTGQLFFRLFSLPRTLQIILLIYAAAAIFLAWHYNGKGRKWVLSVIAGLMAAHFILWQPWSPLQLHVNRLGQVFEFKPLANYKEYQEDINTRELVAEINGPDVEAVVTMYTSNVPPFKSLMINGKPDASNAPMSSDMKTQVLLSHLPMLLHPDPQNVFVLGVGSGITSGEALKFPEVENVTTAELAAEVFEASKYFADDNNRYWENPKHRMVIDDGKTFLRLNLEKFDVISMEPTNVWQEGMAGLFSEDFFRLVRSSLAPGGLVAQWLHAYEVDDQTIDIILKTFSRVFPDSSVFKVSSSDYLLLGYDDRWRFDPLDFERRFYQPPVFESQQKIGHDNPVAILLREVMGREKFREYTTALRAPVNTENFPVLELASEYGRFLGNRVSIFAENDQRINPDSSGLLIDDYFNAAGFRSDQARNAIQTLDPGENDRLRTSFNMKLINGGSPTGSGETTIQEIIMYVEDPRLRETLSHPYRKIPADRLSVDDAFIQIGAELQLWERASSRFWTPGIERLQNLYNHFAERVDRENAGWVAGDIGITLAKAQACRAALPFLRVAEDTGILIQRSISEGHLGVIFSCEIKEGSPHKALRWWDLIEENNFPVTKSLRMDKTLLDIMLGAEPPSSVYGKLPSRL